MSAIWGALVTFGGILVFVAVWSRLVNDKQVPGLITDTANALANIFKGVFRG